MWYEMNSLRKANWDENLNEKRNPNMGKFGEERSRQRQWDTNALKVDRNWHDYQVMTMNSWVSVLLETSWNSELSFQRIKEKKPMLTNYKSHLLRVSPIVRTDCRSICNYAQPRKILCYVIIKTKGGEKDDWIME